jgi:hypothetical protein
MFLRVPRYRARGALREAICARRCSTSGRSRSRSRPLPVDRSFRIPYHHLHRLWAPGSADAGLGKSSQLISFRMISARATVLQQQQHQLHDAVVHQPADLGTAAERQVLEVVQRPRYPPVQARRQRGRCGWATTSVGSTPRMSSMACGLGQNVASESIVGCSIMCCTLGSSNGRRGRPRRGIIQPRAAPPLPLRWL